MSNIKEVMASGVIPYHWTEELDKEQLDYVKLFLSPTIGIKLTYHGRAGERPNKWNGQTAYYNFEITGEEGLRFEYFDNLKKLMEKAGAEFSAFNVRDIENRSGWVAIK